MSLIQASLQESLRDAGLDIEMRPVSGILFPRIRAARTAEGIWLETPELRAPLGPMAQTFELPAHGLRATWVHLAQLSNDATIDCQDTLLRLDRAGEFQGYARMLTVRPQQPKTPTKRWASALADSQDAAGFAGFLTQTCASSEGLFRRSPTVLHVHEFELRDAVPGAGTAVLRAGCEVLGHVLGATVATHVLTPQGYTWESRIGTLELLAAAPKFQADLASLADAYEAGLGAVLVAEGIAQRCKMAVHSIDPRFRVWFGDDGRWSVLEADKH